MTYTGYEKRQEHLEDLIFAGQVQEQLDLNFKGIYKLIEIEDETATVIVSNRETMVHYTDILTNEEFEYSPENVALITGLFLLQGV